MFSLKEENGNVTNLHDFITSCAIFCIFYQEVVPVFGDFMTAILKLRKLHGCGWTI